MLQAIQNSPQSVSSRLPNINSTNTSIDQIDTNPRQLISPLSQAGPIAHTTRNTPSLRQINPRKFTVDQLSQLQMRMVLSGTASTGGTDFSPPPPVFRAIVQGQA